MEYNIQQISTENLERYDTLSETDKQAISEFQINSAFNTRTHFSEINFYTEDNTLLFTDSNYNDYKVLANGLTNDPDQTSTIALDPEQDLKTYMFEGNNVKVLYNFLNNLYTDFNSNDDFIIKEVSGDRTEIRLQPLTLEDDVVTQKTTELLQRLNSNSYFTEFSLYRQNNIFYTGVNIKTQVVNDTLYLVVKLYQPLPSDVQINTKVSVVEQVSDPVAFSIEPIPQQAEQQQSLKLKGPNFSIDVDEQSNEASQFLNYNELFSVAASKSTSQLNSLINEKSAELSIDYNSFEDFINYS